MPRISVGKWWENCDSVVLKYVIIFPQFWLHFNYGLFSRWKNQRFSRIIHRSFQKKNTANNYRITGYIQTFFHFIHRTYYYDYYLFNKKGIA